VYNKHSPDYQNLFPQILYRTLQLSQQNKIEDKWPLPIKIDVTRNNGIEIVHFFSLGKKLELPSKKYDQYYLKIHIGAIRCLQFEKQSNFINDSIESICDLCFRHSEVNLEALKHLTECVSLLSKIQWKKFSVFIYKVLMGQLNHHLPSIHDQCILLFNKCLNLEDLDYILNIVMTEISWSLRIKYYMLTVIISKYGVKKVHIILFNFN